MVEIKVVHKQHFKLPEQIEGPTEVKVGFPAASGIDGEIINIAIWNHYGTSRGIPARPFLLNAVRANRRKYIDAMKADAPYILAGKVTLRQALTSLGILAEDDIKQEITNLKTPPNAPSTIRQKGSSNPLIDTGTMRGSVRYKVVS